MDLKNTAMLIRGALVTRVREFAPPLARRMSPSVRNWLLETLAEAAAAAGKSELYERLNEKQGKAVPPDSSIGAGDFDLFGAVELQLLRNHGLQPGDTVVDFGCGTGRLAVHLIPVLEGGRYIGIDIAPSMLDHAQRRVHQRVPSPRCDIVWVKQISPRFDLAADSVDMICAFSVFTHMEHEDTHNYLAAALRVVRPGGTFVLSCLPMDLAVAREIFLAQARLDLSARWASVRNVTTTVEMIERVAKCAGWDVVRWYRGDEPNIDLPGRGQCALGQSSCVLVRPV